MNHSAITISALNCYPVKSCKGIPLQSATIGATGIAYDRQWMVVNESNVFVAQRGDKALGATGIRSMCLIAQSFAGQYLKLEAPGMEPLLVPLEGIANNEKKVRVWQDMCVGIDQGNEAAEWFTDYLSREVPGSYRLVRMPDQYERVTELGNSKVGFADAYPFSLTSEATLNHLNSHLADSLPMDRFRPNIVMSGGNAFRELSLKAFSINGIEFIAVKRDGRCTMTTIDQTTGQAGKEPLATLATLMEDGQYVYKLGNNVYFGMYLVHDGTGVITVGDHFEFHP